MKIKNLKINGIKNPMGFSYEKLLCSWLVTATQAKHQKMVRLQVSKDASFSSLLYTKEGENLSCLGEPLYIVLAPYTTYYWRVEVEGDNGERACSETAFFETAKMGDKWQGEWIGTEDKDTFHPVFLKSFQLADRKVGRARIYLCGLGLYEASINGEKVGKEYLAPFLNDYLEAYQYQTYDITGMLQKENEIRVMLGKGWYMGTFGLEGQSEIYGSQMMLCGELRIEYEDGTVDVIGTDTAWKYQGSDIEDSGIYFGEIYNHQLWRNRENPLKMAVKKEQKRPLAERYSLPVVAKETIRPIAMIHTPAGETVVDMGQNFAGYMEFSADFPAGTRVTFECGEILQQGNFFHDNYKNARSAFVYVSDGHKEVVRPHFTYFGFRYLKVTGWPGELTAEDIQGKVVYSDIDRTGYIKTSNEKINRLYQNCLWGQKSNFIDIPTDCPQRSERLGWTGDAQVFAPTASLNCDTRAFYRKFLKDLRSEQKRINGAIPNYFPNLEAFGGACSVWGDVAAFVPAQIYQTFGCLEEVREYYPLMRDWVEYMTAVDVQNGREYLFRSEHQFGDWLALDGITEQSFKGSTDDDYIGSVYYYQSSKITGEMAERLGIPEDAEKYKNLAENIGTAVLREYFSQTGRLAVDTQAAYIIALKFGIYVDKEKLIKQFKNRLKRDCYEIKCGFVGAPLLCTTLCENGMTDLAYHFLFNEDFPGWLYCVNLGATTIWERWNSVLPDGSISGTGMNSLNHYAYGTVVQFFYEYIAGIRSTEPGFKKAEIKPEPDVRFHFFNCTYQSASGNYVSNWEIKEDGTFKMHVEIPFNCEARVMLPGSGGQEEMLKAGSYDFEYYPAEDYRKAYNEKTCLKRVAGDERVLKILKRDLPQAYGIIQSNDKERLMLTFEELGGMFYMGFNPEMVKKAASQIFALSNY